MIPILQCCRDGSHRGHEWTSTLFYKSMVHRTLYWCEGVTWRDRLLAFIKRKL